MAKHNDGLAIQERPCDTNPLSSVEEDLCGSLRARSRPTPKMAWKILEPDWKYRLTPYNPVELVILERPLDDIAWNQPTNVIFRQRKGNPSQGEAWAGAYHFPGSYLGGGEFIAHAIQRILTDEIAHDASLASWRLICTSNLPCMVRNHDVSLVCLVTLANGSFITFKDGVSIQRLDQPPQPLIPHHVGLQQRVMRWINLYRRLKMVLTRNELQEFLDATNVLESDVE